ncbi:triacylglycerol lipase [Streptococcus oralis subsp. tigurinus]|uniref:Triacylglycerol lipase n=1 Tax=Streptococcus oralis subsp. tigurinus TaxID=1077464 RepID=A0A1X0WY86_STROR|nr:Mbeg1-like protein [Streptococcus oralis]ORJ31768.1 triacylglycerol lipase [Streptococcus oralis subsp. tigurinus]
MRKYVDDSNLQIAMTEYNDNSIDREVKDQYDQSVGTVTQVYNNTTGAGEQVYAVVKNTNEKAEDVQEVTVLFRGSTGPDHILNEAPDVWNDWAENDAVIAKRIVMQSNPSDRDNSTEQLKASARALKDIMEKYPNAKINIYGHSLGSMDAQYAMADLEAAQIERIQQAHIYNGPDVYRILSPEQRKIVDQIKGRIYNYADPKDMISMVGRDPSKGSIGSVGMVYYVDSDQEDFVNQHMTYGYRLDKDGKIKILSNTSTVAYNNFLIKMESFKKLKKSLSSDGFTSDERIFLDSEQAKLTASGICHIVTEELDVLKKIYNDGVQDASEVLVSCSNVPWGFTLSPYETEAAYSDGGVTYETTVGVIQKRFTPVLDTAKQLEKDFTDLEKQIQNGIQKKLDEDKALANEFKQWESLI